MSGPTPGPWRLNEETLGGDICTIYGLQAGQGWVHVYGESRYPSGSEQAANASLIAAAPALLAALKYAKRKLESCARLHGNDKVAVASLLEPIDAAIALAEGPQS